MIEEWTKKLDSFVQYNTIFIHMKWFNFLIQSTLQVVKEIDQRQNDFETEQFFTELTGLAVTDWRSKDQGFESRQIQYYMEAMSKPGQADFWLTC